MYQVNDTHGISTYLYRWIDSGRRVAICTRDMSWADDKRIMTLLNRKARAHELIICLPEEIDKSDILKQNGAEIYTYGGPDPIASTFTIVNYGRAGSCVAVGRRRGDKHVIQEFSASDDQPVHDMAVDLIKLVREHNNVYDK